MRKAAAYPAWAEPVDAVAKHHGVDLERGLTAVQVKAYRQRHGFNELEKQPGKPLWKLVLEQFDDMLVKVSARHRAGHVHRCDFLYGADI